jgi:hypothetical protein
VHAGDNSRVANQGPNIQIADGAAHSQLKVHPQSVKQKKSVAGHSLNEISNMTHSIRDPIESLPAQTRDYKSRLHPLKLHSNLPKPKFKLSLDNEERDMVLQNKDMSKDKIW